MERRSRRLHRPRSRRPLRQVDVDFLCLAVFGQRSLPDEMAARIALRREFSTGLAQALQRRPYETDPRPAEPQALEALVAVS